MGCPDIERREGGSKPDVDPADEEEVMNDVQESNEIQFTPTFQGSNNQCEEFESAIPPLALPMKGPENEPESPSSSSPTKGGLESSRSMDRMAKVLTIDTLEIGGKYDVLDSTGRWCEAEIIKIDRTKDRTFVSYLYWDTKFDEWIENIPQRITTLHTHTYIPGGKLKIGQRIQVLDEYNKWLESFVIDENEEEILIHYKNYHSKFDTWLRRNSDRINPYRGKYPFQPHAKSQYYHFIENRASYDERHATIVDSERNGINRRNRTMWAASANRPSRSSCGRGNVFLGEVEERDDNDKENRPSTADSNQMVRYIGDDASRTRKIVNTSEQFQRYQAAMQAQGFNVIPVSGDGNCLFRSVSHQIYGTEDYHSLIRSKCMDYMAVEAPFFAQFVVGGLDSFHIYLEMKRRDGCWGDDPEIEAICELYQRPTEIWAYDSLQGARKLRTFHEAANPFLSLRHQQHQPSASSSSASMNTNANSPNSNSQSNNSARRVQLMRLSYYGGGHYDSIQPLSFTPSRGSASRFLERYRPGEYEDMMIERARQRQLSAQHRSNNDAEHDFAVDGVIARDVQAASDLEATERAELDMALEESRRLTALYDSDDLETCLALSLSSSATPSLASGIVSSSSAAIQGGDLLDSEILQQIQQESEREYLDRAILASLAATNLPTEQASVVPLIPDIPLVTQTDSEMELALKLSTLSEEEALELALQQSLQASSRQLTSSVPQTSNNQSHRVQPSVSSAQNVSGNQVNCILSEEEQLRLAMEESLRSLSLPPQQNSTSNRSNNSNNVRSNIANTSNASNSYLVYGNGFAEEYDEDLIRAIQESLRK